MISAVIAVMMAAVIVVMIAVVMAAVIVVMIAVMMTVRGDGSGLCE